MVDPGDRRLGRAEHRAHGARLRRAAGAAGRPPIADAERIATRAAWGHLQLLGLHVCSLLVRHRWPAAAAVGLFSHRMRGAITAAAIVDAVVFRSRNRADLGLVRYTVGRRLDDIGFGFGWWVGAWRARSASSLLPDLRGVDPPRSHTELATFTRPAR